MAREITVTQALDDGSTQAITQEVPSTPVFLVIGDEDEEEGEDAEELEPALTREIEITLSETVSSVMDQCGKTENRQEGHTHWQITIDGICTDSSRAGNLRLERLKTIGRGDQLRLRSAIHSGPVIVREITITQTNDLKTLDIGSGDETAFEFQLQLREP